MISDKENAMAEEKKPTILVIDDDPDDLEIEKRALEGGGFTVITAADGAEGIELAEKEVPDLIITDILMPKQDGLTTFEEIRKHPKLQKIPVVVCTSASDSLGFSFSEEDMQTYYGESPGAFLEKPVVPEKLQQTVRRLLT
jgi:CheY-like chemotaxis protein